MALLTTTRELAGHLVDSGALETAREAVTRAIDSSTLSAEIKENLKLSFNAIRLNTEGFAVVTAGNEEILVSELNQLLRRGDIRAIFQRVLGREIISSAQEAEAIAVESSLKSSPEVDVRRTQEAASTLKTEIPEAANVTGKTAEELRTKLNRSTIEQIEALYTKAKNALGTAGKVATAIGVVTLGALGIEAIADFISENEGVMVSKKQADGTFITTKFGARSCKSPTTSAPTNPASYKLNIYLYLLNILNTNNTTEKAKVDSVIVPELSKANIPTILANAANVPKLINLYRTSTMADTATPCNLVDNSSSIPCIAWSINSPVTSVNYLDPTKLAANETVVCNGTITVLDALGAIIHRAGVSLIGAANKSLGFDIKWVLAIGAFILIAIFLFTFIKK